MGNRLSELNFSVCKISIISFHRHCFILSVSTYVKFSFKTDRLANADCGQDIIRCYNSVENTGIINILFSVIRIS